MELDSPAVREAVQALARHAFPAFGIALVVLLCTVWVLWQLIQRYGVHRETSRFTPLAYLLGYLALGFGLIIGAVSLFAEIAENLVDGRKLGQLDQLFSDTIHSTMPIGALQVFAVLTHFGDTLTLTGLCIAGTLWLLRQRRAGRFCLRLGLAGGVHRRAGTPALPPAPILKRRAAQRRGHQKVI